MKNFNEALAAFKAAAVDLAAAWELKAAAVDLSAAWELDQRPVANYPSYLPSFDQFVEHLQEMTVTRPIALGHALPPVGAIVRARHDIAPGGGLHWPMGWTGVVKGYDGEVLLVECHRYLGPGAHEWDNCRALTSDDADDGRDDLSKSQRVAIAFHAEFEVLS